MTEQPAAAVSGCTIRAVTADDLSDLKRVHVRAFGDDGEARLVGLLHQQCDALVSLLAERDGEIVGHILFSPASVEPATGISLYGLAPMAVTPKLQRGGIGTALMQSGLAACREADIDALVVLGHFDYYPRFGFRRARDFGLGCVYDVPDEAFMALELAPGALADVRGTVHYHPAFAEL